MLNYVLKQDVKIRFITYMTYDVYIYTRKIFLKNQF